jgi:hypothetical protein
MATWGAGSFENDAAADWTNDLEQADGIEFIIDTVEGIADSEDYLEATECQEAIAAAEIIAALKGRPAARLPENAQAWVEQRGHPPGQEPVTLALRAVEQILVDSELRELWEEGAPEEWYAAMDDLRRRLEE